MNGDGDGERGDGNRGRNRDDHSDRDWGWLFWLAVLSPVAVPWVVVWTTSATLVFPWGMVTVESWHVTSLPGYLSATVGLPRHLQVWPLGVLCYGLAITWAAGERFGADQRVTAGLLALAAITAAWLASGLGIEPNRTAFPLGSILLVLLALWAYARSTSPSEA